MPHGVPRASQSPKKPARYIPITTRAPIMPITMIAINVAWPSLHFQQVRLDLNISGVTRDNHIRSPKDSIAIFRRMNVCD